MIQRIKSSIGYLIGLTVIGQILSFVKESIFAYYYGTTSSADAYVMASQIPVVLFAVVTTSINTVTLPIYTSKRKEEGEEAADSFLKSFIVVFELICILLVFLFCLFTKQIAFIFAPAFNGELLVLTIRYTRLLFPTILLSSAINILTVRYNANKKFAYTQCVSFFQNTAIVLMMILFASDYGTDAAVYGIIFGLVLNTAFLIYPCRKIFVQKLGIGGLWIDIKKVLRRVIPVACGVGIAEINRVIDKAIASGLDTGSITALNYANKLAVVFSALIITALSTVCFQKFSELYVRGEFQARFDELVKYISVLIFVLLPITCGALLMKTELITAVFARGAFGEDSIALTSDVFFYYSIGILPIALRELLSKYFYSSGDTKTPMINSVIGVIVNIVLNLILSRFMGASGLALATTISYFVVCFLMLNIIVKEQIGVQTALFLKDIRFSILGAIIMSLAILVLKQVILFHSSIINLIFYIGVGILVYFLTYFIFAKDRLKKMIRLLFDRI